MHESIEIHSAGRFRILALREDTLHDEPCDTYQVVDADGATLHHATSLDAARAWLRMQLDRDAAPRIAMAARPPRIG